MATDVVRADLGTAVSERPYARSWLNVLIDLIERVPGSPWIVYLAVTIPVIVLANVQAWMAGMTNVGELSLQQTGWGIFTVALVAAVHVLDRIAQSSFDAARPLLGTSDAEADRLRYELTVIPARPAMFILIACIPLTLGYYVGDPVGSAVAGMPILPLALRAVSEIFSSAVLVVLLYHTLRQLRLVRRIVDKASHVDLFQPQPLYGFSRLTAGTGIVFILVVVTGIILAPGGIETATNALYLSWYIAFIVFAVAAFAVPLMGLHNRLVTEKQRLQAESEERLKGILAELNRDVDSRDIGRADALNKTLSSLLLQRDVLARLPTWPWSMTTLRAFVSAIMLPLALFLVQRFLSQVV